MVETLLFRSRNEQRAPITLAIVVLLSFWDFETFHNPVRLHSSQHFPSPIAFESSLTTNY